MSSPEQLLAANARWARKRRRLAAYGQWEPFVDAEPVREHVRAIHATGIPYQSISRGAGLSRWALDHVMWGHKDSGPGGRVRKEIAEALLAYWPTLDDFPDGSRVDACGTRRRLQALMVRGFTYRVIAPRCGLSVDTLERALTIDRVTARVARAVRDAYNVLWDRSPEETGVRAAVAEQQRRRFAAKGWSPTLAWDDDTIDDPAATPKLDASRPAPSSDANAVDRWLLGESVVLDADGRRAALRYLMEWTAMSVGEIGERLGVEGDSVSRSWERIKERARTAGEPVPARRVYVPMEGRWDSADGDFTEAA
jgi:lambda repressor-like predicted transcriptional regulator